MEKIQSFCEKRIIKKILRIYSKSQGVAGWLVKDVPMKQCNLIIYLYYGKALENNGNL
jgi:hypothetical protein